MSNYISKDLAERQPGTLFAGIDLSLKDLVVIVLNSNGNRLDRFRTGNDASGYVHLRERLQRLRTKHGAPAVVVGMEPTHYRCVCLSRGN
jgi:hypothetical protein